MATIAEVVLRNFKSFRLAKAPLSSNFVCIVGANGAGKSNLIDSIRFAFGESSLKALRAHKVQDLIYTGSECATIKVILNCDGEQVEIIRAIRADGKTKCMLNGRRTTRTAIVDFLRSLGIELGEQNIIAQGEVEKIVRMSSRERREIIDEIAGIKEFEEKKKNSLSELERVQQKINEACIILREKESFLAELEKEKDAALKYNELKELLRRAKGTIVQLEQKKVESELLKLSKKVEDLKAELNTLSAENERITQQISSLEAKKNEITNLITSREHQKLYNEVESLKARLSADLMILDEKETNLRRLRLTISQCQNEKAEVEKNISKFTTESKSLAARCVELRESISQFEEMRAKVISGWAEKRKRLDQIKDEIAQKERELNDINSRIQSLHVQEKAISELAVIQRNADELLAKKMQLQSKILDIDEKILKVKEELLRVRPPNHYSALKGLGGVHGAVCELFEVDSKYSSACSTAAGQRLSWIVVEDISKAVECIELLKKSGDFATFIPLNVRYSKERRTAPSWSLGYVIDHIRFDKKFTAVFEYIFGDTLIVDGANELKRACGEGFRAVTLDGDLIERSGVVSGGRKRRSYAELSAEIERLKDEKENLSREILTIENEITNVRRKIFETEAKINVSESPRISDLIIETEEDAREIERVLLDLYGERERLSKAFETGEDEIERAHIDSKLTALRSELAAIEAKIGGESIVLLQEQLNRISSTLKSLRVDEQNAINDIKGLKSRIAHIERKLAEKEAALAKGGMELERAFTESKEIQSQIDVLVTEKGKIAKRIEKIKEDLIRADAQAEILRTRVVDLKAEVAAYEGVVLLPGSREEVEQAMRNAEAELAALGEVNARAPEMWEIKKKEYDELAQKVSTLAQEREAVLKVIDEIELRKKDVFLRTFSAVARNFKKLAHSLGDFESELLLENPENPFDGGLQINVRFGQKERAIETMSGGEKTLLTIIFVFALHMVKPSPFYILDEVEAALDKENSKRFAAMLSELAKETQFILVTHNDAVIPFANVAIGVAKTKWGSKIVSVKLAA